MLLKSEYVFKIFCYSERLYIFNNYMNYFDFC